MGDKKKAKIMLVEDDETQAMMYQLEFSNFGYSLILAGSGKEALQFAVKERPDLIFIDMILGDMNGLELLKKLKAGKFTKESKMVVLSNLQKGELVKEVRQAGAIDFLVKMQLVPKDVVARAKKYLSNVN